MLSSLKVRISGRHRILVINLLLMAFLGLIVIACEGSKGDPGSSCSVVDNGDGTKTISCADGTTATISDGAVGSCSVTDNGDGTKTISCDDGTSVTISDGTGGSACWDLDDNGVCDLVPEDQNGDGSCTVADCAGQSVGVLSGTVTNALTDAPVSGAEVVLSPAIEGLTISTGADGMFSETVPVGAYSLTIEKDNFEDGSVMASVLAGGTAMVMVELDPDGKVVVSAGADQESVPGGAVSLAASAEIMDDSTISSYSWMQTSGADAVIIGGDTANASVTLADDAAYTAELFSHLDDLDRVRVVGINHHALELAEEVEFEVTVTTSSGMYKDTVHVTIELPYAVNPGLQNVPNDKPVLVSGKVQADYAWSLAGPGGSTATLNDAATRYPWFTPDVVGAYTLTEATSGDFMVYSGTWSGSISGQDADGRPLSASCTGCHAPDGSGAPAMFADWAKTGHAEIFSVNLDTSTHYGSSCFECHTVGYDTDADNGGIDEASDYADFLNAGLLNNPGDNWTTVLSDHPATAKLGNIQCENCHGPNQDSTLHLNGVEKDAERVSISSDVCGACHGEPARHARLQQWELSGHASYELAIDEGTVDERGGLATHCGRCHSGQGFIEWISQATPASGWVLGINPYAPLSPENEQALIDLGLAADAVHPVTCVVCHDPHKQGTGSGEPNTATVRISDNTPMLPSGFQALGVGRGAICFTCHNTRGGAHNDNNPPTSWSAPHSPSQADVVMGQNAYFVMPGQRGPHSYINDSCANCHMEQTPPPADLSYNLGGTNHTFAASDKICANCHGEFNATGLMTAMDAELHALEDAIAEVVVFQLNDNGAFYVDLSEGDGTDFATVDLSGTNEVLDVEVTESHGQMEFIVHLAEAVDLGDGASTELELPLRDVHWEGSLNNVWDPDGEITKAVWNYLLLHGDDSHGVHNPSFVTTVVNATKMAVMDLLD